MKKKGMSSAAGDAGAGKSASHDLVERAQKEFEGPLIGYAAGLLGGDWERARDVVQDTFVKLYQQETELVEGRLKSWLYTVCRNRSIDVLRKEKPMTVTESESFDSMDDARPDPAESIETQERYAEVMRYVERLPENQREVIRLKFQSDLSYKEIAEITNLSVSNVGFLLHTGIKRLRFMMGVSDGD